MIVDPNQHAHVYATVVHTHTPTHPHTHAHTHTRTHCHTHKRGYLYHNSNFRTHSVKCWQLERMPTNKHSNHVSEPGLIINAQISHKHNSHMQTHAICTTRRTLVHTHTCVDGHSFKPCTVNALSAVCPVPNFDLVNLVVTVFRQQTSIKKNTGNGTWSDRVGLGGGAGNEFPCQDG
jgi:hypothetical protein